MLTLFPFVQHSIRLLLYFQQFTHKRAANVYYYCVLFIASSSSSLINGHFDSPFCWQTSSARFNIVDFASSSQTYYTPLTKYTENINIIFNVSYMKRVSACISWWIAPTLPINLTSHRFLFYSYQSNIHIFSRSLHRTLNYTIYVEQNMYWISTIHTLTHFVYVQIV